MNENQRKQVYKILTMPIECTGYSNGENIEIKVDGSVIKTTQTYYPYKEWNGEKKDIPLDPDMSDFSVGFYDILYKDILKNPILNEDDEFYDKEFAGDTMNSFNTIANLISGAGSSSYNRTLFQYWPTYLQEYHNKYHCLANFWLIPMHIGRTSKYTPYKYKKLSKTSYEYDIQDYMDRFLNLFKNNISQYKNLYCNYFDSINSFDHFARLHNLVGSYIYGDMSIFEFSKNKSDFEYIIKFIQDRIELRATAISMSQYAEELWKYFYKLRLLVD